MPYGGKFLIRRSVRIIPAHKKHRRPGRCPSGAAIYADVQRSLSRPIIGHTPRKLPPCGAISRFIALETLPGVLSPLRAYLHIIKEKSPCVKGIFLFCLQNFHLFFVVFAYHAIVFTVPTNSGTLLLSKIMNRNGLSRSISTVGGTSIMAESAQTISV